MGLNGCKPPQIMRIRHFTSAFCSYLKGWVGMEVPVALARHQPSFCSDSPCPQFGKTLSILGRKASYDPLWVPSALHLLLPKHPFPEVVHGSGLTDGVEREGVWLWGGSVVGIGEHVKIPEP